MLVQLWRVDLGQRWLELVAVKQDAQENVRLEPEMGSRALS